MDTRRARFGTNPARLGTGVAGAWTVPSRCGSGGSGGTRDETTRSRWPRRPRRGEAAMEDERGVGEEVRDVGGDAPRCET
jgi:hypothetical protein